jgi:uncharacterized protein (UPF0305 family)
MNTLEEFRNHEDQFIKDTVEEILQLKNAYKDGNLSKEQLEELVNDLLELQEVRKLSTSLERKTTLLQTIKNIQTIINQGALFL